MHVDTDTGLVFHQGAFYRSKHAVRGLQMLTLAFGLIYVLLGTRFLLTYVGANRSSVLAQKIWECTAVLHVPFRHLVGAGVDPAGHPIDWSVIAAICTYGVLHWVSRQVVVAFARPRP